MTNKKTAAKPAVIAAGTKVKPPATLIINADHFLDNIGMTRAEFDAGTAQGIHDAKQGATQV